MLKRKITHNLVIIAALTFIVGCGQNASAQKSKSEVISFPDLLRMFADQPDHMADRTLVVNGGVIRIKFAKKQGRIRQEFYPLEGANSLKNGTYRDYKIITISNPNQPTLAFDPQEKTYAEVPEGFQMGSFDIGNFLQSASTQLGKVSAERVGVETVEGYAATKIRLRFEGEMEEMYFYFAPDLKNLLLKMDSGTIKQIKGSYTISNVSFDVPDMLLEMPKDYKRVDFNAMNSVIKQKALK